MGYRIRGLPPQVVAPYAGLFDAALAAMGARRLLADGPGFPCRVTLEDAARGERVILFNHVTHDVDTPFRNSFAIFVREDAVAAADHRDELPPALRGRALGLKGYDAEGMMVTALLTLPGAAEAGIGELFDNPAIAYIQAHNAAHGCFAATIERA